MPGVWDGAWRTQWGGEVRQWRQWEKHLHLSLWGQFGCEGSKYGDRTIEVDVVSMKDLV